MSQPEPITPEDAIAILHDASDALSHASYCVIVGMVPKAGGIQPQWDRLRALIECLHPKPNFEPEPPEPTLMIVEVESK